MSGEVVGERFSLSFDEWTSPRNRRYLNITDKILIFGIYVLQWYEEKLEKHKLNLHTDIVAIIKNDSRAMQKVGRIINMDQQLCFAHGMQLGVIEVWSKQYDEEEIWFDESDSLLHNNILANLLLIILNPLFLVYFESTYHFWWALSYFFFLVTIKTNSTSNDSFVKIYFDLVHMCL